MSDPFLRVVRALHDRHVRFVVIGVWGANYYAPGGAASFRTRDRDLFLPPDPANLLQAWHACDEAGLALRAADEPLEGVDIPVARLLHIVRSNAVRSSGDAGASPIARRARNTRARSAPRRWSTADPARE